VVLGAGLAGLSAAQRLGDACEVFEKAPYVGGHCRTKEVGGFLFDEGAHVFFGSNECAQRFVWEPLGDEMVRREAEIWNDYGQRRFGRYPVQANAHALPPELATRCVLDFVEASRDDAAPVRNYAEWCYASFGRTFADNFMLRYARKVWTVEPEELTLDWLGSSVGGRIARPSMEQVLRGAIDPVPQTLNYLTRFAYPASGGFGRIVAPVAGAAGAVRLGCGVAAIESGARRVVLEDGSARHYQAVVATMPLPELVARVVDAPPEIREAARRLMWTSVRCVNVGVRRPDVGPGHWVYFYDEEVPFFRISFPSKLSAGNAPAGTSSVSCEVAYSRRRPLPEDGLAERVLVCLRQEGILDDADELLVRDEIDIPYAYVVFDFARAQALSAIHAWMREVALFPCGRFAEWGYHWSFDALESGQRVAEEVAGRLGLPSR
jgi:protoporphyrinogen oxidase